MPELPINSSSSVPQKYQPASIQKGADLVDPAQLAQSIKELQTNIVALKNIKQFQKGIHQSPEKDWLATLTFDSKEYNKVVDAMNKALAEQTAIKRAEEKIEAARSNIALKFREVIEKGFPLE